MKNLLKPCGKFPTWAWDAGLSAVVLALVIGKGVPIYQASQHKAALKAEQEISEVEFRSKQIVQSKMYGVSGYSCDSGVPMTAEMVNDQATIAKAPLTNQTEPNYVVSGDGEQSWLGDIELINGEPVVTMHYKGCPDIAKAYGFDHGRDDQTFPETQTATK